LLRLKAYFCKEKKLRVKRKWSTEGFLDASSLKSKLSQAPGAHACNPSYSGGSNQEDPVQSHPRPNLEKYPTQKGLVEWSRW
jgi:hypothetical protein